MASWQDGAEYAPIERPDGFATPRAEPLEAAPASEPVTPGAVAAPQSLEPVDARPLSELGANGRPGRDPSSPFEVTRSTMTSVPTMPDGTRDPRAPFQVTSSTAVVETQPPPPAPHTVLIPTTPTTTLRPTAPQPVPPQPGNPWPPAQRPAAGANTPAHAPHLNQQWPPPAVPATPGMQDVAPKRRLLILSAVLCGFGALIPSSGPLLLMLTGLVARLRVPWVRTLGSVAVGTGSALLLLQLLSDPGALDPLVSLIAFGFAIAYVAGLDGSRGRQQPPRRGL